MTVPGTLQGGPRQRPEPAPRSCPSAPSPGPRRKRGPTDVSAATAIGRGRTRRSANPGRFEMCHRFEVACSPRRRLRDLHSPVSSGWQLSLGQREPPGGIRRKRFADILTAVDHEIVWGVLYALHLVPLFAWRRNKIVTECVTPTPGDGPRQIRIPDGKTLRDSFSICASTTTTVRTN